ncbi:MAG: hypothetical protein RIC55_03320 [Pirellulaceae bacterium]
MNVLQLLRSIRRPLFAGGLVIGILGLVQLYMLFVASVPLASYDTSMRAAEGVFAVELTLTFDAGSDGFTLENESPVVVDFRGRNLMEGRGPFLMGEVITVSPVEGIVQSRDGQGGVNSFAVDVTAKPPERDAFALDAPTTSTQLAHAVRLRILRDGQPVAEETLWSEPGQPVQGVVTLTVEGEPDREHSH